MGHVSEILSQGKEKSLRFRKEIIFMFVIFLVASISFALGYLAHDESSRAPIIIEKR
jgi:hypothetical protein